jgi:hypothetical protein
MDSNLFKEAIADAKAVRQTALANAKVALEEAFTERYKAMFAEKLKEEAEQETAMPEEGGMQQQSAAAVSEQEIDELIKELEAEVGEEPHPEPEGDEAGGVPPPPAAGAAPDGVPPVGAPPMGGAPMGGAPMGGPAPTVCPPGTIPCPGAPGGQPIPQAGAAPMGAGAPPMGGAPMGGAPEGMPPMGGAPEGMPPEGGAPEMGGAPEGMPPEGQQPPPSDVPAPAGEEEDEEFDLNELLESLKAEIGENAEEEEEEEEEGKKLDEQTKLTSSGIGSGKAGGSPNKKPSAAASSTSKIESAANDDEGYPTTDQAKVVAKEATTANRPNKATNATKDNLSTPSFGGKGGNSGSGQSEIGYPKTDQAKVTAKEASGATRPNQAKNATKTNLSTPGGMLEENAFLKKQINEAEDVIRYVKGQLNEVNLLNAKLLYTNKLFKSYNMNNEHKMRIVEMFDLAKTVREVKLTYANITESLNFGGTEVKRKSQTSSTVQSITEGLASGAVASTKPKAIITEGKFASRMKQLAGIRSEPTKK